MATKNLTASKNIFKTLLLFSLPLILSNLITQSYNLVDLIIAGRVIGSDALSATGVSSTFIQFLSSIFWGFGVALSTYTGELYGEGNYEKVVKCIKTGIMFISLVMFVICGVCIIIAPQIMTWLKVDPLIFDSSTSYFRIFMVSLLIQSINYQITAYLHSLGNTKFPMAMTLVSGVGNVLLNLLFVLPPLNLGVNGLAYATIASNGISLIMGVLYTLKIVKELGGTNKLEFDGNILAYLSKLAIPCIFQQCALYLSSIVVQPRINAMGKDYSGAFSIAMNMNLVFNAIFHSMSRATATYTSQCKGAGLHDRYTKGIMTGVALQIILTAPLQIATIIWPYQIFSIFVKDGQTQCLEYAVTYAYTLVPFMWFYFVQNLLHSFYKSVEAMKTVVITTVIFTASRILFTFILPENGKLSSVFWGLTIAYIVECLILVALYFIGWWRSKDIKQYQLEHKKNKKSEA